jgi:hypothetical protein
MTLGAVGGTSDLLHHLMILLINDLKFSWPEGSELMNSGLSGAQIGGGLKPHQTFCAFFSDDVVVLRFHISEEGLLSTLRA